ncbi:MAG: type IV pilus modification protein PilV [Haliea sp.]|uniref:type IV pilus modification protein PilV n=1 Tax=Haliea sp. TaxID=1932666 RepID=UPI0032EDBB5A
MSVVTRRIGLRGRQRGVTLIEALAAFVILSIGLLGIVSLQALSKSAQHQAVQRSRAVTLGNDLLERIRVNPAGLEFYVVADDAPVGGGTFEEAPDTDCAAAVCTPEALAAYDLWRWEQTLDGAAVTITEDAVTANTAGLIDPRGCTVFEADPNKDRTGTMNVIIQWRGLSESTDAVAVGEIACGGAVSGSDPFRRQVIVSSYVIDEDEICNVTPC